MPRSPASEFPRLFSICGAESCFVAYSTDDRIIEIVGSELMVRPSLRTRSVGARLTASEYDSLKRQAEASGQSLSEWCREVMLASVNGQPPNGERGDGGSEALMAEVVALRANLLNVLFKQVNGERLTPEEMQWLIDRADSDKVRKARERLEQPSDSKEK